MVHIGQLTSEVRNTAPPEPPAGSASGGATSRWEDDATVAGTMNRLALDRLRTATGPDR